VRPLLRLNFAGDLLDFTGDLLGGFQPIAVNNLISQELLTILIS
jgi:hypothetical protein